MSACAVCDNIADYLIDAIICHGNCRKLLHIRCINAPFSSIKLFKERKSFYFFCDDCDPFAYNNIVRDVLQNKLHIENLHNQLLQLNKQVTNNIASSRSHISNKNNPSSCDTAPNTDKRQTRSKTKVKNISSRPKSSSKRKSNELDAENSLQNPLVKKTATSIFDCVTPSRPLQNFNFNYDAPNPPTLLPSSAIPLLKTPTEKSLTSAHTSPKVTEPTTTIRPTTPTLITGTDECQMSSKPIILSVATLPNFHSMGVNNIDTSNFPLQACHVQEQNNSKMPFESRLKIVEGQKILFISKLDPSTNALDIKNFIKNKIGTLQSIIVEKMLQRNYSKYSSFKIRCSDSVFYLLNNESFWPSGIVMHEFVNRTLKKQPNHFHKHLTMQTSNCSNFNKY